MDFQAPIHDLYIRQLQPREEPSGIRIPILSDCDHLLRRFGAAEFIHLKPNSQHNMGIRAVADEIWALLEGQVLFAWHDLRLTSPSHGCRHQLFCKEPTLVLVPFGVAFGQQTEESPASLLRIMTHLDGEHEGDHEISWEEGE